jgi:hypothetical protein
MAPYAAGAKSSAAFNNILKMRYQRTIEKRQRRRPDQKNRDLGTWALI